MMRLVLLLMLVVLGRQSCRFVLVVVFGVGEELHEPLLEVEERRESPEIAVIVGHGAIPRGAGGVPAPARTYDDGCGLGGVVIVALVESVVRGVVLRGDRIQYPRR